MKIILPSFTGHRAEATAFLRSLQEKALDKSENEVILILSHADLDAFAHFKRDFADLNLRTVTLRQMLRPHQITASETQLLNRLGKFNFQTLKKLLATLIYGHDFNLICDSEHFLLRPCRLTDLAAEYATHRSVYYATTLQTPGHHDVGRVCQSIWQQSYQPIWMFEVQNWFMEERLLRAVVDQLGGVRGLFNTLSKPENNIVFEFVLLWFYAYGQDDRFGYDFKHSETVLTQYLGEAFPSFMTGIRTSRFTPLEFPTFGLNDETYAPLLDLYAKENIRFIRPISDGEPLPDLKLHPEFIERQKSFLRDCKGIKMLTCLPRCDKLFSDVA